MEIVQVVGFGVLAAVSVLFIRQSRPDIAHLLSIGAGVVIVVYVLGYLRMIVNVITDLALEAEINTIYLRTLLRVVGVAYLAEFGAQICRDADENGFAAKIEFAGKIIILIMAIPILMAVLESIINFIP